MRPEIHSPPAGNRFYWLIYLDSALFLHAEDNKIKLVRSLVLDRTGDPESGVQSLLNQFYKDTELPAPDKTDLCFLNSVFHSTEEGVLECFMNHRSGFLFYHQAFFDSPVTSGHVAPRLVTLMKGWLAEHPEANLWFHLRHETLYILFSVGKGSVSVSAFEVRKVLDVHYYILFHLKTLKPVLGGKIQKMVVSGELLEMDGLFNFIEENSPGTELTALSSLIIFPGLMEHDYRAFLPEINY